MEEKITKKRITHNSRHGQCTILNRWSAPSNTNSSIATGFLHLLYWLRQAGIKASPSTHVCCGPPPDGIHASIISHFSLICSICFARIGFRTRIFSSSLPPTVLRPSISGNESWISHCVSSGCSFTVTVPISVSDRRNPLKQEKTLDDCDDGQRRQWQQEQQQQHQRALQQLFAFFRNVSHCMQKPKIREMRGERIELKSGFDWPGGGNGFEKKSCKKVAPSRGRNEIKVEVLSRALGDRHAMKQWNAIWFDYRRHALPFGKDLALEGLTFEDSLAGAWFAIDFDDLPVVVLRVVGVLDEAGFHLEGIVLGEEGENDLV